VRNTDRPEPSQEEMDIFRDLIQENRYDFVKLAYIIFGFGEKGSEVEDIAPYEWQIEELKKISRHLQNPLTRYTTYRLIVSSGNGAAKTALGAMIMIILLYTHKLRGRVTANTKPQITSIIWPEYDIWLRRARYNEFFFNKMGESIKALDSEYAESWRFDTFSWNEATPARVSGLHNKGHAILYTFEEAPGIPGIIWNYASGAFTDVDTIKIWLAFGNSDDPESMFEQNMTSDEWNSKRIDTRDMSHVDPAEVAKWLREAGGDEDNDEFRVRVRGMARKSSKDAIIAQEHVASAIEKGNNFDPESVKILPSYLTIDPAWTGDETCIWHHQGMYSCLLEKFTLDKMQAQTHQYTYQKACYWEKKLKVDIVLIDQGEGTALKTLAQNAGKYHWELISFANTPNDAPTFQDSQYANMRAQMYYEANKHLLAGGVICCREPEWEPEVIKQLAWTKGGAHKTNLKKKAEPKQDIKDRVMRSPDLADGYVLRFSRTITERLPENDPNFHDSDNIMTGQQPYVMPDHNDPYEDGGVNGLYD